MGVGASKVSGKDLQALLSPGKVSGKNRERCHRSRCQKNPKEKIASATAGVGASIVQRKISQALPAAGAKPGKHEGKTRERYCNRAVPENHKGKNRER